MSFVDEPIWIPLSQQSLKQDSLGCLLAIGDTARHFAALAGLGANRFTDVLALQQTLARAPSARGDRIARTVSRERRFEQRTVAMVMGLFPMCFVLISRCFNWGGVLHYEQRIVIQRFDR